MRSIDETRTDGCIGWNSGLTTGFRPKAQNPGTPNELTLKVDMAGANHFLAEQEVVGGYGHVSVRGPGKFDCRYLDVALDCSGTCDPRPTFSPMILSIAIPSMRRARNYLMNASFMAKFR